ncbi:MAG: thiamine phosphate synthase [Pseudomonadota bacterium]|nr:thiamine phosphate synthase [Pseudomonadota bacterium]
MGKPRIPPRGLYAITPDLIATEALLDAVEAAIRGGAIWIQYRTAAFEDRKRQAQALCQLCHRCRVPLIVNDDPRLAWDIGADGVHLGQDDPHYEEARALLGPQAILGVSCYNSLDRAVSAQRIGANYVAFGRFFPSKTKPEAKQAPLALLHEARRQLSIPIVAIGGITPENGGALIEAGADLLAVIEGVFGQPDLEATARRYTELFRDYPVI